MWQPSAWQWGLGTEFISRLKTEPNAANKASKNKNCFMILNHRNVYIREGVDMGYWT